MAKKKPETETPVATAMPAMPAMPMMPPAMGMPGMAMPAQGAGNPMFGPMQMQMQMLQMMQMMQMMGGGMMGAGVDPSAIPFAQAQAVADGDRGLDGDIIRPALLTDRIKVQQAVPMGSVLDYLCLSEDGKRPLGGLPKGCTMALAGPPGKGKTRTALAGVARVAATGSKVALVVAEEGFHNTPEAGRDDLCSRFVKIGMSALGIDEKTFTKKVLENVYVMESQYHKGQSWDDFVAKYRYLVEKEEIRFVVIDSLNMLDPTKNRTADNLSALKTYNHEKGITCLCIGQIRDTGQPVGGEALQHTADAVFLIEEIGLQSKEMAEFWGGKYRDRIDVIRAVKSVTTPTWPHPLKLGRDAANGLLIMAPDQPAEYKPPAEA